MIKLDVYISESCWSCRETERIVEDMRKQFPDVDMKLLDIDPDDWPHAVFAVPTWVLDGQVISLGNPTRDGLRSKLSDAQTPTESTAVNGDFPHDINEQRRKSST